MTTSLRPDPGVGARGYPTKRVTIVVPQTAGSLADRLTRALAPEIAKFLGQAVVVENKPGAQGVVGSEYVAKQAPADGYTILMTSLTNISSFALMVKERSFDPLKDLTPITGFAEGKLFFGSSPRQPWTTFDELAAHARAHPGKLRYGASSSSNRLQTELMLRYRGLNLIYNPFDATAAYQQSIAAGDTHMGLMPEPAAIGWGDKIRYLAQTGEKRSAAFSNVPTFAELGLPQIRGVTYTLNVRTGTPEEVVERLNAAASEALNQAEVKVQFGKFLLEVFAQTPEAAAKSLARHAQSLAEMAETVGMQPQ